MGETTSQFHRIGRLCPERQLRGRTEDGTLTLIGVRCHNESLLLARFECCWSIINFTADFGGDERILTATEAVLLINGRKNKYKGFMCDMRRNDDRS